jgi:septum formation protein
MGTRKRVPIPERVSNLTKPLILASSSPRRHQILKDENILYEVMVPDIDEVTLTSPIETALSNAKLKAEKIFANHPLRFVLASDTVVAVDQHVLGKPENEADAFRILRLISGRRQSVISSFCILGPNCNILDYDITFVTMREMTDLEIERYIKSGEPFGKAGAYAIQENGDQFVSKIEGSFNNVVGLPIEKILPHLKKFQLT